MNLIIEIIREKTRRQSEWIRGRKRRKNNLTIIF